jgi:hypothetical protein
MGISVLLRRYNRCHHNTTIASKSLPITIGKRSKTNFKQIATVTVTASTTVGVPLPACTNYGLEFAAYPYIHLSTYDPTIYKSQTPEVSGVTTTYTFNTWLFGYPYPPLSLYGSSPIALDLIAVNHRGYFIATKPGTYTFTAEVVDDWLSLWLGPTAFSGWNLANAAFTATFPTGNGVSYSVQLETGLYPIRVMWANGGGPGQFGFSIQGPDGSMLEEMNSPPSHYLVTDCAEVGTLPYPPFGSE